MHEIQIYTCVAEDDMFTDASQTVNRVEQQQNYLAFILREQYEINPTFLDDNQQLNFSIPVIFLPIISKRSIDDLSWNAKVESFLQKMNKAPQSINIALFTPDYKDTNLPNILSIYSFKKISLFEFYEAEKNEENLDNLLFNLFDIADTIVKLLKTKKTSKKKTQSNIKVFLAEVSRELSLAREVIRRELIGRGVEVFPEEDLTTNEQQLEEIIIENLKKCSLSIHLFGSTPSEKRTDAGILIDDFQNKIASQYSNQDEAILSNFQKVIWMPQNLKPKDKEQERLISQILKDSSLQSQSDLIKSSIEELKDVIENTLFQSKLKMRDITHSDKKVVYVIHKKANTNTLKKIKNIFENQSITVEYPTNLDNAFESLLQHRKHLLSCSGVFILYNNEEEAWLRSKMNDVLKIKNYRKKAYEFKAIGIWSNSIDYDDSIFEGVKWIKMKEGFTIDNFLELV